MGWLAVGPPGALAHANLVRSDPSDPCAILSFSRLPQLPQADLPCATGMVLRQPPRFVRLYFNERVDLIGRGVRVFGPGGRRVEVGPAQISGTAVSAKVNAAEPGTYRVIWRVVASDTHPAQGTFAFSVGHSSGPPAGMAAGAGSPARPTVGLALQTLARALHFAGYAMSFGVIGFRQLVLVPLSLADDVSSERRLWRLVGAGVLTLLIAEPLALVAQTTSLGAAGDGPFDLELAGGALDSSFGRVLAQRLGAAVLLWVLVGAVRNTHIGEMQMAWAVLPLGAVVALIDGEAAHAVGTRPAWAGLSINMVHEAAMGLWLGGLLGLLSIYRMPGIASRRGAIVARTTRIALVLVTVLIITGTVMALQHLTGLRDLAATAYGRTLLVKLCVLAAGLAIAWAAVSAPVDGRPRWWVREAGALLGLLALAGLLVSLRPPI